MGKPRAFSRACLWFVSRLCGAAPSAWRRAARSGSGLASRAAGTGGLRRPLGSSRRLAPAPLVPAEDRPASSSAGLLAAIQTLVADLPTYGYRRVHALLRRQAEREGRPAPNVKRVYRVMKVHGLLLQRHAGDLFSGVSASTIEAGQNLDQLKLTVTN